MPANIRDVVEKIRAEWPPTVPTEIIERIARRTIALIGKAIDNHGEIYDPAPAPALTPATMRQTGVRWSGGRSPRRRGRR